MEYTIHRISLDIHTAKSQATLRVKQYDTSRKLHITLCEGGLPYHIATDCTATFSAIKADDKYIHNTCQIDGNTIEYTFTEQTTAAVGATECEIALYNNKGQRITSPHFTIIVEERVYNGEEIVSSSEANVLNDLIDRAEVAVDNAEKVVDSIYHYVESNFANAFKGNMSGAIVQADDVSPVEHIVGCKVRCRNLYNNLLDYTKTHESEWTYENGTLYVANYYVNKFIALEEGKTYTFSYNSTKTGGNGGGIYLRAYNESKNGYEYINYNSYTESTVITFTMPIGHPMLRLTFYGDTAPSTYSATYTDIMLEEGSKATGYVPYIEDFSSVKVTRCGKNLIPFPYYQTKSTANGGTITVQDDGGVAFSGIPTGYVGVPIYKGEALVRSGNITLSTAGNGKNYLVLFYMYNESGELMSTKSTTGKPLTLNMDDYPAITDWNITCARAVSDVEISGVIYPMIEIGTTATEYESYSATTHAVSPDGTVNGLKSVSPTMTITTDNANAVVEIEYNRDSNKVVKGLYDLIMQETVVNTKVSSVKLLADAWEGDASPYSQAVSIPGVTENSMVDLTPSVEQLAVFHNKDLAFVTENVGGVVTVYAIGQKPTNDYTIPVAITEVKA